MPHSEYQGLRHLSHQPPREFVGRAVELAQLEGEYVRLKGRPTPAVAGVFGVSGIGKSTLCRKFAANMRQKYGPTSIWLDCGDVMQLWNSMSKNILRSTRNLRNLPLIKTFTDMEELHQNDGPIIVILDNVLGDIRRGQLDSSVTFNEDLSEDLQGKCTNALKCLEDTIEHVVEQDGDTFDISHLISSVRHDANLPMELNPATTIANRLQEKQLREFVQKISNFTNPHSPHGMLFLITAVNESAVPVCAEPRIKLSHLTRGETETLIRREFRLCKASSVRTVKIIDKFANYDAQTIRQVAYLYRSPDAGFDSVEELLDVMPGSLDQSPVDDMNPCQLLPMNVLFKYLQIETIRMLCILTFFPNNDIPKALCKLVAKHVPYRDRENTQDPVYWERALAQLEKMDLVMSELNAAKTISIHLRQQSQVMAILNKYFPAFWKGVARAFINSRTEVGHLGNRSLMDKFSEIAMSVWDHKIPGEEMGFLEIPTFLDDNAFPLFANNRYTFLHEITTKCIELAAEDEEVELPAANPEFLKLASRYIYTSLYYYMDYTNGITKVLHVREIYPDFEVDSKNRNSRDQNRVYLSFMCIIFVILVAAISTPFWFWWYYDPVFDLQWFDVVGVAALAFNAVFVPIMQLRLFISKSKVRTRALYQYCLILFYVFCFGMHKLLEDIRFPHYVRRENSNSKTNLKDWINIPGQVELVYVIVAVVSLCWVHGFKPTVSIIVATMDKFQPQGWIVVLKKLVSINHPEICHFIFSILVLVFFVWRYIKFTIEVGGEPVELTAPLVILDVMFIFVVYNFLILKAFKYFILLSLWLSFYWERLTDRFG